MGKNKMIAKSCPKCDHQVAVACKACKCGHSFFNARKNTTTTRAPSPEDQRRRTGRVRREKPNYYDSQEFEKTKKRQTKPRNSECDDEDYVAGPSTRRDSISNNGTTASRAKRRRARKEEIDGGGDLAASLPPDKQVLCSIILAELNRKMKQVVWQLPNENKDGK